MKKIKVLLVLPILVFLNSCGYNSMVEKQEAVERSWSDVETQYQRRMNLIDNLVQTVKGYANFEQETLTKVIEARSKATSVTLKVDQLSEENVKKYQEAQSQLNGTLSRLMAVAENYPDLKANEGFRDLRTELVGSENRVSTAIKYFNEAVGDYNTYIRKFPNNLTASMFGFEKKGYFKAEEGAAKVPTVKF
jgi:LemA protein